MVDELTGDAPNIGGNDGADLLQVGAPYRDFRPSVQLASTLFADARAYDEGSWDDVCSWLDVKLPATRLPPLTSRRYDDGGYVVLREAETSVVMRYPRYRFRPGHADPLHVDLWVKGRNVLRDGGTFSYNADADRMAYFSGIRSHNTIQFDDEEPMPRVGRFLFGSWLKTSWRSDVIDNSFGAGYLDAAGHQHLRTITLQDQRLVVKDDFTHVRKRATLRWRLAPGDWQLSDNTVTDGVCTITVSSSESAVFRLTSGLESRHYLQTNTLPVLEVEVERAGRFETEIGWR